MCTQHIYYPYTSSIRDYEIGTSSAEFWIIGITAAHTTPATCV